MTLQMRVGNYRPINPAARELSAELTVTRSYWRKQNPTVRGKILKGFRHACQKYFKWAIGTSDCQLISL
jgi:hypothetical protein